MAIKTTIGESKAQEKEFPKLMKNIRDTSIVLMTSNLGVGTLVRTGHFSPPMGDFRINWNMNEFTDFNEPLTLQNK
jgi:hypothetical protein